MAETPPPPGKKDDVKDDKVAIASGISITVVVILLVCWAIFFFHKIQNGSQQLNLNSGTQGQFNPKSVQEAQQQLQNTYNNSNHDLIEMRNELNSSGGSVQQQAVKVDDNTNQFSGSTNQ